MSSKDEVRKFLLENTTEYQSGEAIAEKLGLSRNAVWKAIESLRKDGYEIDAITRRGYRIVGNVDRLSETQIKALLPPSIAEHLEFYESIDSTNVRAKVAAISGAPSGSIYISEKQTAGNGRKNHSYESPEGGIYLSVLLRPEAPKSELDFDSTSDNKPDLSGKGGTLSDGLLGMSRSSRLEDNEYMMQAVVQAVQSTIQEVLGLHTTADHNDIYLYDEATERDRKVCGILLEAGTEFESDDLQWLVIGVGLNVRTDISKLPEEVRERAGSLVGTDAKPVMNELAAKLILSILQIAQ